MNCPNTPANRYHHHHGSEHSLIPVSFRNDTVFIIPHEGEPLVPLKPICRNLGLDWKSQHAKLAESHLASTILSITTVAADGKKREMACMMLRKFPGWLYSISPSKVRSDIRAKLEAYQNECDDVLWRYWNGETAKSLVTIPEERLTEIIREAASVGARLAVERLERRFKIHRRARKITNEDISRFNNYVRRGLSTATACRMEMVSPSTFRKYTKEVRAAWRAIRGGSA